MLAAYDYPGNIRELRSILHAAANLAQGRPIAPGHLPASGSNPKSGIRFRAAANKRIRRFSVGKRKSAYFKYLSSNG